MATTQDAASASRTCSALRGADPGDRRRVVVRARPEITARFGVASDDNPYSEITASMNRVHERFTVDELRVVERYFEAVNADVP